MAVSVALPTRLARTSRDRTLITPEGVSLPMTLASRSARATALALDLLFIGVVLIVVTIGLISLAGGVANLIGKFELSGNALGALQFLLIVWMIGVFFSRYAWFLWFELGPRGATPGKRITGIRIAARDGGRLSAEMVIARNLLRDIELFLPITFIASAGLDSPPAWIAAAAWLAIFLLFPCFNRDRLRAGDVVAGTWVVEAPRMKLEPTLRVSHPVSSHEQYRFSDAELAVYGEYELQTLERILRQDQDAAIASVQSTIAAKIGRPPSEDNHRAFLEAYYRQLREKLEAGLRMGKRKEDKFSDAG